MYVDERHLRPWNFKQRVMLRGQFTQAPADGDHQVRRFNPLEQLGIGADAEIAGVTGMGLIEQMPTPKRCADRQRVFFGKSGHAVASLLRQRLPPRITIGARAPINSSANFCISGAPGDVSIAVKGGASSTAMRSTSISSGMATTTGPGRPLAAV